MEHQWILVIGPRGLRTVSYRMTEWQNRWMTACHAGTNPAATMWNAPHSEMKSTTFRSWFICVHSLKEVLVNSTKWKYLFLSPTQRIEYQSDTSYEGKLNRFLHPLILSLLVVYLVKTKWLKYDWNMTELQAHLYSSYSTRQELSNEYQHDRI